MQEGVRGVGGGDEEVVQGAEDVEGAGGGGEGVEGSGGGVVVDGEGRGPVVRLGAAGAGAAGLVVVMS